MAPRTTGVLKDIIAAAVLVICAVVTTGTSGSASRRSPAAPPSSPPPSAAPAPAVADGPLPEWLTTSTPVGGSRCLVELTYFCVSKQGVHLFLRGGGDGTNGTAAPSAAAAAAKPARRDAVATSAGRQRLEGSEPIAAAPPQGGGLGVGVPTLLAIVSLSLIAAVQFCGVAQATALRAVSLTALLCVVYNIALQPAAGEALAVRPPLQHTQESFRGDKSYRLRKGVRHPPKPNLPYCQEMSAKDPPFRSHLDTEALPEFSDELGYVYPSTPFWYTPFHLWLSSVAAFDTTRRLGLLNSTTHIQWYQGKYRWMPASRPILNGPKETTHFKTSPLLHCLGRRAYGFGEIDPSEKRCYKRGYLGVGLWDTLPLVTTNNSFGSHFDRGLVQDWMVRVAGCVGWNMQASLLAACSSERIKAVLLQRKQGRRVLGEDTMLAAMRGLGWDASPDYPEEKTFAQQLEIFATADVLVSAYGSGLTWLPFMRRDSVVLAIIPGKGAGGDAFLQGLHGPDEPVNRNTAFGTWARHVNYYTVTSDEVPADPKVKNWKLQNVAVSQGHFASFLSAASGHLSGRRKSCDSW